MKKIYTAPEATLTGFEATEKLANIIGFDKQISLQSSTPDTPVDPESGDINIIT